MEALKVSAVIGEAERLIVALDNAVVIPDADWGALSLALKALPAGEEGS